LEFIKVDVEEQTAWLYYTAPLLLQMEKEMEDEVYFPNLGNSIRLLLDSLPGAQVKISAAYLKLADAVLKGTLVLNQFYLVFFISP